jgi:hypothetical protein
VGTTYVVRKGDCLSSIAFEHGFLWDAIWNHPDNAGLRSLRKDPDVLLEGDVVAIPDPAPKQVSVPTMANHRFVLRTAPTMLRLRITERKPPAPKSAGASGPAAQDPPKHVSTEDPAYDPVRVTPSPRANVPFELIIDGKSIAGKTDGDGKIEQPIAPNARKATLILEPGTPGEQSIEVALGALDPLDTIPGVKQRLANLGYECGDRTDEENVDWARALRAFQAHCGLTESGELDDATRAKVHALHGT